MDQGSDDGDYGHAVGRDFHLGNRVAEEVRIIIAIGFDLWRFLAGQVRLENLMHRHPAIPRNRPWLKINRFDDALKFHSDRDGNG